MDEIDKIPSIDALESWFSLARMERYAEAPDPGVLYVWDVRLKKAYLEDIEHVEVLLRNFIANRLAADCERAVGDRSWFDHPDRYNVSDSFRRSVATVKSRIGYEGKSVTYDQIIAGISLDVWRFLLVSRLEPTVWRALSDKRNGGMPHYPGTNRADFERNVIIVYRMRNRCSYQEHLIQNDLEAEARNLDTCSEALDWVARKIDPSAADWIRVNSRIAELRFQRP